MTDLIDAFSRLVSLVVAFCGVAGTAFFIWGAYQYMSAAGSPQKAETGKSAMLQAGTGVILVLVAFTVINTLTSQIGASSGAVQIEQIAATDSSRLVAPRVVALTRRYGAGGTIPYIDVFFSEPILVETKVEADLQLTTKDNGNLNCRGGPTPQRQVVCVDATDPRLQSHVPLVIEGFIFQRGATIIDVDGNKALYQFQSVRINGLLSTSHTQTVTID